MASATNSISASNQRLPAQTPVPAAGAPNLRDLLVRLEASIKINRVLFAYLEEVKRAAQATTAEDLQTYLGHATILAGKLHQLFEETPSSTGLQSMRDQFAIMQNKVGELQRLQTSPARLEHREVTPITAISPESRSGARAAALFLHSLHLA